MSEQGRDGDLLPLASQWPLQQRSMPRQVKEENAGYTDTLGHWALDCLCISPEELDLAEFT